MASWKRFGQACAALLLTVCVATCGLGRRDDEGASLTDPVIAASVNGRDIYLEDVRALAVQRGYLQEGEDLDGSSDAYFFALEELIEIRLFAEEAEERGLDRDPDVRRQLALARERVLAGAIYADISQKAAEPRAVERAYQENVSQLTEGEEIHLRHIQFETRDAALAAKRRLENGERFEAIAFEVSTDRITAAQGGDLGFRSEESYPEPIRQLMQNANVGELLGPVRTDSGWHLIRLQDRRQRGAPSLETLRPRIVEWRTFQEHQALLEKLKGDASIIMTRERDSGVEPGGEVTAPADRPSAAAPAPSPGAAAAPAAPAAGATPAVPPPVGAPGRTPPPYPFPMGPGGVNAGPAAAPPPAPLAPAAAAPAAPATPPAQQPAPRPRPRPAPTPAAPPAETPSLPLPPAQPLPNPTP